MMVSKKRMHEGTLPVFPSSSSSVTISRINHHFGKVQSTMFSVWKGLEVEEFLAEKERFLGYFVGQFTYLTNIGML